MAAILLLDRFLFKAASAWVPNYSPDVNDPPSKVFVASQTDSGSMLVENGLDQPYAGALVSLTGPVYTLNGKLLRYSAWHYKFRFIPETFKNLARFENDCKVCVKSRPNSSTKIRNVANYSTQWNVDTGAFQIDHDPPGWLDSGYVPSPAVTTPGDWHTMDFRFSFDDVALTFSIESVKWDDELYVMPAQHRNIPMSLTNWEACRKLQLQNEGFHAGTVLVEYDDGVMAWSDQPIGSVIPDRESYGD
jgi:hypothetical protein